MKNDQYDIRQISKLESFFSSNAQTSLDFL